MQPTTRTSALHQIVVAYSLMRICSDSCAFVHPSPLFDPLTLTFCSTSQNATTHWLHSTENAETKS